MNPKIEKFWKHFGKVFVQTEPNEDLGLTNVPIYWFDRDNSLQRLIIAAPYNGILVYRHPAHESDWICEDLMIRIIRQKVFF